jgi:cobalt-precorrin 5A hydrolase
VIIAGIGCRRDCAAEDIFAIVRLAAERAGAAPTALATSAAKAATPALREAAAVLALPLLPVAGPALEAAAPRCATRSAASLRATGLPSLAEAAALAAAGEGSRLLLPRIAGARATCALAAPP